MGNQLKEKEFTKYLGILIDNKLTWSHHINHIKLKIYKRITILTKSRRFVSRETLRLLFFTFVHPHIDYGLFWYGEVQQLVVIYLNPIQSKLSEAIRKMYLKKNKHPAEPLFKQHKISNFKNQKLHASACFMWSV